jgi:hypothetical protein
LSLLTGVQDRFAGNVLPSRVAWYVTRPSLAMTVKTGRPTFPQNQNSILTHLLKPILRDLTMTNYCNYCWREADKTTNEEGDTVHWCAYHFLEIASAEESKDTFAQNMGYESAEEVYEEVENQEEPTIEISEAISLANKLTDPRGGSQEPSKKPVVYTTELRQKLAERA